MHTASPSQKLSSSHRDIAAHKSSNTSLAASAIATPANQGAFSEKEDEEAEDPARSPLRAREADS